MVANVKLFKKSKHNTTQGSKQKQFQVHNHVPNSNKTHKSTWCQATKPSGIDATWHHQFYVTLLIDVIDV